MSPTLICVGEVGRCNDLKAKLSFKTYMHQFKNNCHTYDSHSNALILYLMGVIICVGDVLAHIKGGFAHVNFVWAK
jgi:hypothetical protein